ncbi:hypothetical protein EVAR_54394_1 [Eumeta japonica]|uniref:Uncharacterized protein n=1 Tax=Eumeta variegata TaxID=151549 RepID=A0A4C1Y6P5_EUMVA|nr:hypothetical protein EVAR_54394_1 [Eumeta japonica]
MAGSVLSVRRRQPKEFSAIAVGIKCDSSFPRLSKVKRFTSFGRQPSVATRQRSRLGHKKSIQPSYNTGFPYETPTCV